MKTSELRKIVESSIKKHLKEAVEYTPEQLETICQKASKKFPGATWRYSSGGIDYESFNVYAAKNGQHREMVGFFHIDDARKAIILFKARSTSHHKLDFYFRKEEDSFIGGRKMFEFIESLLKKYPDLKP